MIQVQNLTKTYGQGATAFKALDDVSFSAPDGASVAIVGRSGSGKSTLMHIISGLDRPETGQIMIDGQNTLSLSPEQVDAFRSRQMGFIFQSFFVQANETCYDNISMPLEIAKVPQAERKTLIDAALTKVELSDKAREKAGNLSGGQKQRLAIARAIATNPRILFADEPTGNLDTTTSAVIEDLLFSFTQTGGTLIVVTHDPELASKCDMQVHLKDGRVENITGKAPAGASNAA